MHQEFRGAAALKEQGRKAVLVMYVWSALAGGAGLAFTYLDRDDVIFALPVAVTAMVVYTLFPAITKALKDRI